jgi:hypothetical protein
MEPDALIQFIQEPVQAAVRRFTSGHLQQDCAHFRGYVFDRPVKLDLRDGWIAGVVELKRPRGIGGGTEDMFGLLNIRQWMRVSAGGGKAGGAGGRGSSWIPCNPSSGKRRQGKGTQLSGALAPTGKHPDAFQRGTRAGV